MQHVKQRWLQLYTYSLILIDAAIIILYMLSKTGLLNVPQTVGVTTVNTVVASVHMLFCITVYRWLAKNLTWYANMISAAIFGILIASSLTPKEPLWHFWAIFIISTFMFAMNGLFVPLAGVTIAWIVVIIQIANHEPFNFVIDIVMLSLATFAGVIGWLFFKRWYIDDSSKINNAIKNLLEQEKDVNLTLLNSISDGVMIINSKGTVRIINQAAADLLGWKKSEATNLDYRSLIRIVPEGEDSDISQKRAIAKCLSTGKPARLTQLIELKNGERKYVDVSASPITSADNNSQEKSVGVITVIRNVDEQKRQEQQRSDFISTASHEMRTPVAAIEGFVELALNPKVATIDEKARGYLEKAKESTQHLGRLFQDLLTASRSEDGRLQNNPKLIEIGEFLKKTIEPERMKAEKKGLKIVYETGENDAAKNVAPLLYAEVDPDRLREVVLNLFDNAIKYTDKGIITLGTSMKQQSVVIRVADTGMGIAEEDISHLFQKFYRTDNSATREIGGTGLGLYISKQLVELMGGRIWAESSVGAGSTFFIELPRISADRLNQIRNLQATNNQTATNS